MLSFQMEKTTLLLGNLSTATISSADWAGTLAKINKN